jgi:hypothetical protein
MTSSASTEAAGVAWWARGLLFENCNCQTVCPGHVHFDQACTHDRCVGLWAIRFDEGEYEGVSLAGAKAIVAYDSPRHMIEGGWVERIIVDSGSAPEVRRAVDAILTGAAGGPWAVLARFVGRRLETRALPIAIDDDEATKRAAVEGLLETTVKPIRGRDRSRPVTFENMFNQIHATSQVVATGATRYDDGAIRVSTEGTHGLFSTFHWSVGA